MVAAEEEQPAEEMAEHQCEGEPFLEEKASQCGLIVAANSAYLYLRPSQIMYLLQRPKPSFCQAFCLLTGSDSQHPQSGCHFACATTSQCEASFGSQDQYWSRRN